MTMPRPNKRLSSFCNTNSMDLPLSTKRVDWWEIRVHETLNWWHCIHKQNTNAFDLDILSFLAGVRQEDSANTGKKAKYPACNVRESSTVGHVLSLLAKTGYHRVFVTNTYMEPVGVISELDILRFRLGKRASFNCHMIYHNLAE